MNNMDSNSTPNLVLSPSNLTNTNTNINNNTNTHFNNVKKSCINIFPTKIYIQNFQFDKLYSNHILIKNLMDFSMILNANSSDFKKFYIKEKILRLNVQQSFMLEYRIKINKKFDNMYFYCNQNLYLTLKNDICDIKIPVVLDYMHNSTSNIGIFNNNNNSNSNMNNNVSASNIHSKKNTNMLEMRNESCLNYNSNNTNRYMNYNMSNNNLNNNAMSNDYRSYTNSNTKNNAVDDNSLLDNMVDIDNMDNISMNNYENMEIPIIPKVIIYLFLLVYL